MTNKLGEKSTCTTKKHSHAPAARFRKCPPFCYLRPGMTAEEGALSAIKALEITYPLDSLAILWILRRDIEQSETARKRKST